MDELAAISIFLKHNENLGGFHVYEAARQTVFCNILKAKKIEFNDWQKEMNMVVQYLASAHPSVITRNDKAIDDYNVQTITLRVNSCSLKNEFNGFNGIKISFTECMCGGHRGSGYVGVSDEKLDELRQILSTFRLAQNNQIKVREPASDQKK